MLPQQPKTTSMLRELDNYCNPPRQCRYYCTPSRLSHSSSAQVVGARTLERFVTTSMSACKRDGSTSAATQQNIVAGRNCKKKRKPFSWQSTAKKGCQRLMLMRTDKTATAGACANQKAAYFINSIWRQIGNNKIIATLRVSNKQHIRTY